MSQITFTKIELENYSVYKERTEYQFTDKGFVRIVGKNLDKNPEASELELGEASGMSGIGKSEFFQSIPYAIWGYIVKKKAKDKVINKETGKDLCVALEFYKSSDNTFYRIERYRKHSKYKNGLFLYKATQSSNEYEWQDLSLADINLTQKLIDDVIEINPEIFMKSSLLSRDNSKNIFELPLHGRVELVESLIRIEKLFKNIVFSIKREIATLKKQNELVIKDYISSSSTKNAFILSIKREIASYRKETTSLDDEESILQLKLEDMSSFASSAKEADKILKEYRIFLQDYKNNSSELKNSNIVFLSSKNSITKDLKSLKKDRKEKNHLLLKIISLKLNLDKCPHCGEALKNNDEEVVKIQKKIIDLLEAINSYKIELKTSLKTIKSTKSSIELLQSSLKVKRPEFDIIPDTLKKDIIESIKNKTKTSFEEDLNKIIKESEDVVKKRVYLKDKLAKSISSCRVDLQKIRKIFKEKSYEKYEIEENLKLANWWDDAMTFGNEASIKSFLVGKILPVFNTILDKILLKIYSGKMTINFDSSFQENIMYNGKEYEYEEFSSGERAKINLCISLAFFNLTRINILSTNVIILDEIFSSMDGSDIELFVNIFKEQYASDHSIFVISHDNYMADVLGKDIKYLKIEKYGQFTSRIVA